MSVQFNEIQNRPLDDRLINNQTTTFKIWLTFIKKLPLSQFQKMIKFIHQGHYNTESKRSIINATLLYRLSSSENIFSDHYCFNLAISGLFSEIGASLISLNKRKNITVANTRMFKYSSLILSIKTSLPPQNIEMISSAPKLKDNNLICGQETYYFVASYFLCMNICNKKTFSLKQELSGLKQHLPNGHQGEFKNLISRSMEFFGWEQLPDQMTQ